MKLDNVFKSSQGGAWHTAHAESMVKIQGDKDTLGGTMFVAQNYCLSSIPLSTQWDRSIHKDVQKLGEE